MAYLRSFPIYSLTLKGILGLLISVFFLICQVEAQHTNHPGVRPPFPPEEAAAMRAQVASYDKKDVWPGAYDLKAYLPLLLDKRVGLVVNHTSMVGETHLADTLISLGVGIETIFSPEHGFRGQADAGADIANETDPGTGVRIISLYGDKKKPSVSDLRNLDVIVFDIQDVGVRFYTYLATLLHVMESAGENDKPLVVLDRPNPNGHYIDGPVLDTARFRSFVGPLPIPVVYGMTPGEMGRMINGERWIPKACNLAVIPCLNYNHSTPYTLPIRPSPNLPDQRSVLLYPGICFFEGTVMSLGRGTEVPFQVVGHPDYPEHAFSFTPVSRPGAKNPPLKDVKCFGVDLSSVNLDSIYQLRHMDLSVLLSCYQNMDKAKFFNAGWFDKLAGTDAFRKAIEMGWSEERIRESWQKELNSFNERRKKYLLYEDF